jgi:hypothetical protein
LGPRRFFCCSHTTPGLGEVKKRLGVSPFVAATRGARFGAFMRLSRNDGPFLLILSETPRKIAAFRRSSAASIL